MGLLDGKLNKGIPTLGKQQKDTFFHYPETSD